MFRTRLKKKEELEWPVVVARKSAKSSPIPVMGI
jgi:hypothetical protein